MAVFAEVMLELLLGFAWAEDEDFVEVHQFMGNGLEILEGIGPLGIVHGMLASTAAVMRCAVDGLEDGVVAWLSIGSVREDDGFFVVEPDSGGLVVFVRLHKLNFGAPQNVGWSRATAWMLVLDALRFGG